MLNSASIQTLTHTVSSAEGTAGTCSIPINLFVPTSFVVQIMRSGKDITSGAAISISGTYVGAVNLVVATNGSTYVLTTGDVINAMVF